MAEIENGIITFDGEEAEKVKKTFCSGCMVYDCAGPDSKTGIATTYSSETDSQIASQAACSPKIKVQTEV